MNTHLINHMGLPKHALELFENMSLPEPPLPEPVKTTEINSECDLIKNDKSSPDSTCLKKIFFLHNKEIQSTENLFPNQLDESIQTLNDSDSQAQGFQDSTHGQENDAAPNRINYQEFTEKINLKFVETENKIQLSNEQIQTIPNKEFFVTINHKKESKIETKKIDQPKKKINIDIPTVLSDPKIHTTLNTTETVSKAIPTSSTKNKKANETLNCQKDTFGKKRFRQRSQERTDRNIVARKDRKKLNSRESEIDNQIKSLQEEHNLLKMKVQKFQIQFDELRKLILN